ncbi:MAG: hypothetical protein EOO81_11670 [Oxalobacteraceae bacterium]|nr:MAG: hypothetical protein EOO81_11670 [Oxalobacteraceae bacterium]
MQYDDSRAPFGLTMSRYPAHIPQVIAPFSLWWVCMVEDYLLHVPDSEEFVGSLLPGVRGVLEWFEGHLGADDLFGPLPHWNFVDWCRSKVWNGGNPPGTKEGGSSILTLQFALALQSAARMNEKLHGDGDRWQKLADKLMAAVRKECLNTQTMRIADTPAKDTYSQHGNLLAILAGLPMNDSERDTMLSQTLTDTDTVTQATYYFRFYLGRALAVSGRGDEYLNHLKPWHDMLALGLTTWAEEPDPTRSDCHAWSSSPNYEFLATVLGVLPGSLGWKTTTIAPHLGVLTELSGVVPHPSGSGIAVEYKKDGNTLIARITMPQSGPGSEGTFLWRGQKHALRPGVQTITVKVS